MSVNILFPHNFYGLTYVYVHSVSIWSYVQMTVSDSLILHQMFIHGMSNRCWNWGQRFFKVSDRWNERVVHRIQILFFWNLRKNIILKKVPTTVSLCDNLVWNAYGKRIFHAFPYMAEDSNRKPPNISLNQNILRTLIHVVPSQQIQCNARVPKRFVTIVIKISFKFISIDIHPALIITSWLIGEIENVSYHIFVSPFYRQFWNAAWKWTIRIFVWIDRHLGWQSFTWTSGSFGYAFEKFSSTHFSFNKVIDVTMF